MRREVLGWYPYSRCLMDATMYRSLICALIIASVTIQKRPRAQKSEMSNRISTSDDKINSRYKKPGVQHAKYSSNRFATVSQAQNLRVPMANGRSMYSARKVVKNQTGKEARCPVADLKLAI